MSIPARGLLLTYTEPGRALPPSAYETWHDTQHVWRLLNLPGPLFLSATRWTAADTKTPGHIAIYDLASPSAVHDPGYAALLEPGSGPGYDYDSDRTSEERDDGGGRRERRTRTGMATKTDVLKKVETMERRVYELIADESCASRSTTSLALDHDRESDDSEDGHNAGGGWCEPGKYMTVIEVELMKYAEGEFNRWFDEEHIPLLARVPGWVRSRRFVLKEVLGADGWDGERISFCNRTLTNVRKTRA
ncbi:hypothetical protein C8Q80DRAFT_448056 [Daedaleopsis nitida]|nr:hypothetical protein C8Q80DRAFT_448056 [Daedaleopsis nitida]